MKHYFCLFYWNVIDRLPGRIHNRIHQLLWLPAQLGAELMRWWRMRDFENTNPGITVHGVFPWEAHTGQKAYYGFYTKDTDPMFVVWRIGHWFYMLGTGLGQDFNRLVHCYCDDCHEESECD